MSKTQRGFTLIELLVVLVILALFSSVAVLSIGDNTQRKLLSEAERLQSVIIAAADEAVYSGSELGIYLTEGTYQVLRWDRLQSSWVLMQTPAFANYSLPDGLTMRWTVDGFLPPDDSEAIKFEWGNTPEEELDESSLDNREIDLTSEGDVVTDKVPQLLMLSSAELTVFELDIELEEEQIQSRAQLYSDGFELPKIKQYDVNGQIIGLAEE